jgi:hypothetical protein
MPKKPKAEKQLTTEDVVKRVKSVFAEVLVRHWLNTPDPEWNNKTPLQLIKAGKGEKLIEAIKIAEEELKRERTASKHQDESVDGNA